jgi:hypothetical protein
VYYRFRIHRLGFDIRRVAFPLRVVTAVCGLAAALDEDVSLEKISTLAPPDDEDTAYLEGVLS